MGIALAGAGSALIVEGVLLVSGDKLFGGGGGGGSQAPGIVLCLAVILVGYGLIARFVHGPLAAAGTAGAAITLPPLWFFLTYSKSSSPDFATILVLSSALWTVAYLFGPGRGRALFLGAALLGWWLWAMEATEGVFSFPFVLIGGLASSFSSASPFSGSSGNDVFARNVPDPSNLGWISLAFAVVYLVAAVALDRRGRHGIATPFMFAGVLTLFTGIGLHSNDFEEAGTGLALVAVGLVLTRLGPLAARRASTWIGAVAVVVGFVLIVDDAVGDDITTMGALLVVVGAATIVVAHVVSTAWKEPPETEPGPSRFVYSGGSTQPSGPPPPPAGSVLG